MPKLSRVDVWREGEVRMIALGRTTRLASSARQGRDIEVLDVLEAPEGSSLMPSTAQCAYRGKEAFAYTIIRGDEHVEAAIAIETDERTGAVALFAPRKSEMVCTPLMATPGAPQAWRPADRMQRPPRKLSTPDFNIYVSDDGVQWADDNGQYEVSLPAHVKAFVTHHRADHEFQDIDDVDDSIGPLVLEGNRLWFGIQFYEGEGSEGVGGLGFVDLKAHQLGLLRHPALVDCSIGELEVTPRAVTALTFAQYELGEGICNGLVTIDRERLTSTIARPAGDVKTISNKDGELNADEQREARRYEPSSDGLQKRFQDWPRQAGPAAPADFKPGSLEAYMRAQVNGELDWFEGAVKHGSEKYRQRCLISVGKPEETFCEPSLDVDVIRSLGRNGGSQPKDVFERLVGGLINADASNYKCEPGWRQLFAGDRLLPAGSRQLVIEASLRDTVVVSGTGSLQTRVVVGGEAWLWSASDFHIEDTPCQPPFDEMSGPAFKRVTLELSAVDVDQGFVPDTENTP